MDRLDFTLAELKFASGDEAPARAFSGYGAVFGNLDSYGDVIAKGAFKRTLRDYRQADRLPPMLAQHGGFLSAADLMPIGVWTKMVEDDTGLVVEGRLSDTARGNEAYTLLKDGALSGLSIGYVTKEFALGTRPGEPRRTIKDIDLLEVSLVTFPANDRARIDQVKAAARSLSTTDWRDLEGALRDARLVAPRRQEGCVCPEELCSCATQEMPTACFVTKRRLRTWWLRWSRPPTSCHSARKVKPTMPDAVQQAVDGLMVAFEEFKATNDARLAEIEQQGRGRSCASPTSSPGSKATLDQFESINQKLTTAAAAGQGGAGARRRAEGPASNRSRLRLNRPGAGGHDAKAERKALLRRLGARRDQRPAFWAKPTWAKASTRRSSWRRAECKSLSVQTDTTGGYLAPPEYVREIIKGVTEMSPVRQLVRVRQTASKSIQLPKRTGQFAARCVSEQGTRTETAGLTYGHGRDPAPRDVSR